MEKCKGYQRRQSLREKEVKDVPEEMLQKTAQKQPVCSSSDRNEAHLILGWQ
jgi:hypothetical protein